ncbi:MAG: Crp/Fnr family transcriptional regulator [Deltaproteobacteria bacterium]|nr:Crp/Fnr family transcriptional regulator [Deltaproteobacteria bacterium]MBW2419858.1 Crp/Fnr family transcriptional regulator [Deltaproteobacteria bacterium]
MGRMDELGTEAEPDGATARDVWHLRSVDWLQELAPEEIEKLRGASVCLDYTEGDTIFAPATNPNSLYLLEKGLARIYRLSREGEETTFGYVAPGEVFGELTVFGDYPRESFAQAARPCRVWRIPGVEFQRLLSARPSLVLEVTRQIGTRLKRIESRVENLVFRNARSRLAHILIELAEDFGRQTEDGICIDVDITQAELATLVGITRQTANVNLRDFEQEGLTTRSGRQVVLVGIDALRRVALGNDRSEPEAGKG